MVLTVDDLNAIAQVVMQTSKFGNDKEKLPYTLGTVDQQGNLLDIIGQYKKFQGIEEVKGKYWDNVAKLGEKATNRLVHGTPAGQVISMTPNDPITWFAKYLAPFIQLAEDVIPQSDYVQMDLDKYFATLEERYPTSKTRILLRELDYQKALIGYNKNKKALEVIDNDAALLAIANDASS